MNAYNRKHNEFIIKSHNKNHSLSDKLIHDAYLHSKTNQNNGLNFYLGKIEKFLPNSDFQMSTKVKQNISGNFRKGITNKATIAEKLSIKPKIGSDKNSILFLELPKIDFESSWQVKTSVSK